MVPLLPYEATSQLPCLGKKLDRGFLVIPLSDPISFLNTILFRKGTCKIFLNNTYFYLAKYSEMNLYK